MAEIVYLLTNPVMPDLVKIGRTTNLEERLRSLSTHSGVPVPFEVFYACEVADSVKVERQIHEGFGDHRIKLVQHPFCNFPERRTCVPGYTSSVDWRFWSMLPGKYLWRNRKSNRKSETYWSSEGWLTDSGELKA